MPEWSKGADLRPAGVKPRGFKPHSKQLHFSFFIFHFIFHFINASVAQWLERWSYEPSVVGSIPTRGIIMMTIFFCHHFKIKIFKYLIEYVNDIHHKFFLRMSCL